MFFGSDNQTGASSQVLEMINVANRGYTHGYGDDEWCHKAVDALKDVFECDLEAYFVTTGTASNSLALSCMVKPWESILCHDSAHVIIDESTGPALLSGGARLVPVSGGGDKVTADGLRDYFRKAGTNYPHNIQAKALTLTQSSEAGLVYSVDELREINAVAREKELLVHMDGARFANALASVGCTPAELTWKSGVDVLSLGATKCGALCAEAVIFFNRKPAEFFIYHRKRSGHLVSKGRFLGAQFVGWLKDGHWLKLAAHANRCAQKLSEELKSFNWIRPVWPVQANELFYIVPADLASFLQKEGAEFYDWYIEVLPPDMELSDDEIFIRLVTSFASEDSHIEKFVDAVSRYGAGRRAL